MAEQARAGYVSIANTARGSNAERSKSVNWFSDFSQYREWPLVSNIQSQELGLKI